MFEGSGRTKIGQHVGDFARDLDFQPEGNEKPPKGFNKRDIIHFEFCCGLFVCL